MFHFSDFHTSYTILIAYTFSMQCNCNRNFMEVHTTDVLMNTPVCNWRWYSISCMGAYIRV